MPVERHPRSLKRDDRFLAEGIEVSDDQVGPHSACPEVPCTRIGTDDDPGPCSLPPQPSVIVQAKRLHIRQCGGGDGASGDHEGVHDVAGARLGQLGGVGHPNPTRLITGSGSLHASAVATNAGTSTTVPCADASIAPNNIAALCRLSSRVVTGAGPPSIQSMN